MFVRVVEINAKNGKGRELAQTVNDKVLSLLKNHTGFVDEIILTSEGNPDRMLALSFWKTREDAERYNREGFNHVNDIIRNQIEATPQVRTFDVATSTVHRIAAGKAA